jgi:hypothetical protein
VVDSSLLEDQSPALLGFDVEVPVKFRTITPDSCRPSLDSIVSEVDLERNTRFASIGKFQLPIAVSFEEISFSIPQEAEALVDASEKVQKPSRLGSL